MVLQLRSFNDRLDEYKRQLDWASTCWKHQLENLEKTAEHADKQLDARVKALEREHGWTHVESDPEDKALPLENAVGYSAGQDEPEPSRFKLTHEDYRMLLQGNRRSLDEQIRAIIQRTPVVITIEPKKR